MRLCGQAYTSYKVCTTTDAEQFRMKQPEVIRRYRDFCWLHDRLTEQHRGANADAPLLPPLGTVRQSALL